MGTHSVTPEREGFSFEPDSMELPTGAWAKTNRQFLRHDGRDIFALSQGPFRPYLYPVYTPKGFAVTSESPADHPHHNSVWIGSDQICCRVPGAQDLFEDYTYNFYVNETFQGRAPGRIQSISTIGESKVPNHYTLTQTLEWRGPPEWGVAEGRLIAHEQRKFDVTLGQAYHVIDIQSDLRPAQWDILLGPTRHAYFNVRVAESMQTTGIGKLIDSEGRSDGQAISGSNADWVDLTGPVGGGHEAGITVMAHPECGPPNWFVSDWGVISVGHFRDQKKLLAIGENVRFRFRLVVRDIEEVTIDIAALYRAYVEGR